MKNIKSFIVELLAVLALAGCSNFGDMNEDPNIPDDKRYNYNDAALSAVFRKGLPAIEGDDEQRVKSLMVDFYSQVLDGGGFTTKNYLMNDDWNSRMFNRVQTPVADLNIVIRSLMEQGDKYTHSLAVAKIWRVYVASIGIDYFGPIPFAPYKEIVANPPYTSVQDAYNEFFTELDEANAMLKEPCDNYVFKEPAYDIIYQNDAEKWRKFANSLHLRLALRLSEVDEAKCKAEAAKAIANGVMASASDNAYIPPIGDSGWGNKYNYVMFQITWGGPLKMTTTMYNLLTNIGGIAFPEGLTNKRAALNNVANHAVLASHPAAADPRATAMFDPPYGLDGKGGGTWQGYPAGLSATQDGTGDFRSVMYPELGTLIRGGAAYNTRPYDVFLYEEVCFLKAEAAYRNFITGDAKAEYEKGVSASMSTWGVSSAQAADYLASTEKNLAGTSAKYDDTDGAGNTVLEKIITQKYLALFPDMSMEAWSDHRRLNLPLMQVPIQRDENVWGGANKDFKSPANFIKRVQYPAREVQLNKTEYDKGVQLLGGSDRANTSIWWDKNKNYCTFDKVPVNFE
jgi:hypothetical protein